DDTWGEIVHAVISLEPGRTVSAEELIEHCRGYIARYKCPKSLTIWDDLPLSSAGKLQKNEIRARLS
ncbi:MAG: long-chain fatty acid--CoA ligase, partial [Halieaceae bacterium]|nr:long-chain fatty acid--CoA ligase [Halieaceae bacterium]